MDSEYQIKKILNQYIKVNNKEDYNGYKKLITDIEEWHKNEVKKLEIKNFSDKRELLISFSKHINPDLDYVLIANDVEIFISENK